MVRQWGIGLVLAVLAGCMFVQALPPFSFSALAWIAFMPLIAVVQGKGGLFGFVCGIVAGLTSALLSTTRMIGDPVIPDGTFAWNYVGLMVYGVVLGILFIFVGELKERTWARVFQFASLALFAECLTYLKLPAHLGLTQYASSPLVHLSSVIGLYGVTWLVWLVNFTILAPRLRWWPLLGACFTGMATFLPTAEVWQHKIRHIAPKTGGEIAIVQSSNGVDKLLALTQKSGIIVWPETPVSWSDRQKITDFASHSSATIITSMHDQFEPLPHNAAYAFHGSGVSEPYFKRKPFGSESNEITRGDSPKVVEVNGKRIGLNICFDSCFPWVIRDTARLNPDLIALPTLDPRSPNGFIQAIHASFTPFRAAENGVPIARAEWTTWSMIVDADGDILMANEEPGNEMLASANLKEHAHPTVYRAVGEWVLLIPLGLLFLPYRPKKENLPH